MRALTSSTGAVSNTYTYDAYGKTLTSTGSVYNPFKYTGEYTDAESGFVYLRARYYDPESQQFLSVDPALAWTEEAYAYVGGNPTNLRDPWGLDGCGWFPNFFDANSCVRKGLDTEAGKWVAGVGVVAAGGVVIICIASGVCEVAAAGAAVVGGAEAGVVAENELPTVTENALVPESCSLYRAVGPNELRDPTETNIFRGSEQSMTGKWFAENPEHAVKWGNILKGPGNFEVIEVQLPTTAADKLFRLEKLDGIGPARYAEPEDLIGAVWRLLGR